MRRGNKPEIPGAMTVSTRGRHIHLYMRFSPSQWCLTRYCRTSCFRQHQWRCCAHDLIKSMAQWLQTLGGCRACSPPTSCEILPEGSGPKVVLPRADSQPNKWGRHWWKAENGRSVGEKKQAWQQEKERVKIPSAVLMSLLERKNNALTLGLIRRKNAKFSH